LCCNLKNKHMLKLQLVISFFYCASRREGMCQDQQAVMQLRKFTEINKD
jgi:hypothetical protein